jgi:hypothetical protein
MSGIVFTISLITGMSWIVALSLIIFFFSAFGKLDKKDKKVCARLIIGFIFWPSFIF